MSIDPEKLRRVADELEIRGLVERYCDAVVRNHEGDWADTWAEDASWELLGRVSKGRDEIVATWKGLMAHLQVVTQLPHHGVIEIEGDRARGRWLMTEHGRTVHGDQAIFNLGMYTDAYVRDGGRWRFASRKLHLIHGGPPDFSGPLNPLPED